MGRVQAAALAAARRGEAAARRQQEGVNEAAADAVRGAVGHMLRVLMENLETKSRTYKSKVCCAAASVKCLFLRSCSSSFWQASHVSASCLLRATH